MLIPICVLLLSLVTISLAYMEGHVVGGSYADIHQHPHSAFLSVQCVTSTGSKSTWICGASVVNQHILLSAAHCLYGCTTESLISVNAGSENRHEGQNSSTYAFVPHEEYNPKTIENDICLIRIKRWLKLNKVVRRVAILREPPYFEQATVAGWGKIDEYRNLQSDQLMFVPQEVWNQNRCLSFFGSMPKGTICASNQNKTNYPSGGDSGSALVVRGFIQIGLVSHKVPDLARHIIVYTDVGFFYDWIKASSKALACVGQRHYDNIV